MGTALTLEYDGLSRLQSVTGGLTAHSYSYRDITDTQTTTQISEMTYTGLNLTFGYTYDTLGNISTYTAPDGEVITYNYDALGQLLSATGDATYTYTYDKVGNILTANGHTYTYGNADWKDLLTKFDGETITYDASGNPTSYYNGTRWAFTWTNGRNLTTASDGDTSISYTYDASGLRTSKTVDGVTHSYLYASGKLLRESYGSTTLDFFYDENGRPYAFTQNGAIYYYVTNLQGDVVRILNSSGITVGTYEYDPYGNVTSMSGALAATNPLRYRGYYYDKETGFYYLQSRYYDPALGRFINADSLASTGQGIIGNNMFAYCGNNPVNMSDPIGYFSCQFAYKQMDDMGGSSMGMLAGGLMAAGVCVGIAFTLPSFAEILSRAWNGLCIGVRGLVDTMEEALEEALYEVQAYARSISTSNDKYVVHHIVAQKSPGASYARDVLISVGINPEKSGINLAVVPEKIHQSLHTTSYYTYIDMRFAGLQGNREAVIITLIELQSEIQLYCQTGWKVW